MLHNFFCNILPIYLLFVIILTDVLLQSAQYLFRPFLFKLLAG
jgi:hypothetical protein